MEPPSVRGILVASNFQKHQKWIFITIESLSLKGGQVVQKERIRPEERARFPVPDVLRQEDGRPHGGTTEQRDEHRWGTHRKGGTGEDVEGRQGQREVSEAFVQDV